MVEEVLGECLDLQRFGGIDLLSVHGADIEYSIEPDRCRLITDRR